MSKTFFFVSVISLLLFVQNGVLRGQNKTSLEEANKLYAAQNYSEAADIYRKLLDENSQPDDKARLRYNLGMSYRQMKKFADASEQFRQTLSINVSNRPIKQGVLNTYENYHHNSQLEIAKIQYETGDFEAALKSFKDAGKKYPFKSDCGSCIRDENYKMTVFEAATLENLNRNQEAFNAYFKIGHPRLLEIYAANGKFEKLSEIIKKKNAPIVREYMQKYSYSEEKANYFLTTRSYKEFFDFYELSKNDTTDVLFGELKKLAASPQDTYLKDWTAQMLAKNPQASVSLISGELKNLKTYPYIYYRTLGFARSPESIALLKTLARKANSWYDAESLVASLTLAGEAGAAALKELEAESLSENMKLAIRKMKTGDSAARNYLEIKFAPLEKVDLPDEF